MYRSCRETLPDVREALSDVRECPEGLPVCSGVVEKPSRMSERPSRMFGSVRKAILDVWEASRMSGSGLVPLPDVRE